MLQRSGRSSPSAGGGSLPGVVVGFRALSFMPGLLGCRHRSPDGVQENRVRFNASFGIRELEKLDSTINTFPADQFDGRVADYSGVEAFYLRYGSGRNAIESSFAEQRREHRRITQEVVEVIKAIPEHEGILVFLFKQRGTDNVNMET